MIIMIIMIMIITIIMIIIIIIMPSAVNRGHAERPHPQKSDLISWPNLYCSE